MKLSSLNEIEKVNNECKDKLQDFDNSLKIISSQSQLNVNDLVEMKEQVNKSYAELVNETSDVKNSLEVNIDLWNQYELLSNDLLSDIKAIENKTKSETAYQIDLLTIDDKLKNFEDCRSKMVSYKPKLEQVIKLGNEINDKNEEAHINQIVKQTGARYNTVVNLINTIIDRLIDYQQNFAVYSNDSAKFTSWLSDVKNQTDVFNKLNEPGMVSSKVQLDDLKTLLSQVVTRFDELKALNEKGEALYTGVTLDCREVIRKNLKQLRNTYETIHKKLNSLIKKLETDITQKNSIEDNHDQIKQWLVDLSSKVSEDLCATLPEKKIALHANKTLLQDISLHKGLLQQLEKKADSLSDGDSIERIKRTSKEYDNLIQATESRIVVNENHIVAHEMFDKAIENFSDDLLVLKNNWNEMLSLQGEPTAVNHNIEFSDGVLSKKKVFDDQLDDCYKQLNTITNQTHEKGHADLFNSYKTQKDDWLKFISLCEENKNKYEIIKGQCDKFDVSFNDLMAFLKEKESLLKDQCLKSTYENKAEHLNTLKQLLQEIGGKSADISKLNNSVRDMSSDNDYSSKISQMNTKFQTLENLCKDFINRYEIYTNEHLTFNNDFNNFEQNLTSNVDALKMNFEIIFNFENLQDTLRRAKELQDKQNNDNLSFDQITAQGESLYPHTNPEGREIIRQQIRSLKKKWDLYTDDLGAISQKVDSCISQFSEFSDAQEQLSQWLKEVEKSIQSHAELRSTLPEKSLQLQNHKLMHQEILSQASLVDNVCEKAKQLIDETKDVNVTQYLESIKNLFNNIVMKSQGLLNQLNESVENHNNYNLQLNALKTFINDETEKLSSCEIVGDKNENLKKIEKLDAIKANEPNGKAMIQNLNEQFQKVSDGTSTKGQEAMSKELKDITKKLNDIYTSADSYLEKQNEAIANWKTFEEQIDDLKKWCRNNETTFKELPQKNNLEEKENLLKYFKENQDEIIQKESTIDNFVDFSNNLLAKTGVEKIKILSNQILNRYKLLTVLSKEVVNRSHNILNDHKQYHEKFIESDKELVLVEKQLSEITDNFDIKNFNMENSSLLYIEKDKLEISINNLTAMGENILPETGAPGREKIREEIRNIRERFDKVSIDVKKLQKSIDTKSQQWASYQEINQQFNTWLESIEKSVTAEKNISSITAREIRPKILKLKSLSQAILSHNRLLETLNEKSTALDNETSDKNAVDTMNQRYNAVKQTAAELLKNAENILEVMSTFNEMNKTLLDHQKMLWDKLTIYSDFMGTKSELASKLEKITKMQDNVTIDEIKLNEIKNFTDKNVANLPEVISNNLMEDCQKMFVEYDKYKLAIQKVKQDIENRLNLWNQYQESCDKLTQLLDETESNLKNFDLKSTLEEKQEVLKNFQDLFANLKQNENEFDSLSDKASEIMQSCGDSKNTVVVQQIKSRFLSDENAAKEVIKKCEQMVNDHKLFKNRYDQCLQSYLKAKNDLESFNNYKNISDRKELGEMFTKVCALAEQHNALNQLLNSTVELGENMYVTTQIGGREIIGLEIQDLQQKIEELYDAIIDMRMKLESKLSNISGVESSIEKLNTWLNQMKPDCTGEIQKKTTLDEKIGQQKFYENILNDFNGHQNQICVLKEAITNLPASDESISKQTNKVIETFEKYHNTVKEFVDKYEVIVHNHQQYCKAVMDAQDFIQATQSTAELWGDVDLDRVSLGSNLERLNTLLATLPEEEPRISLVCELGEKVIPETIETGKVKIRQQIDASKQDWEHLTATVNSVIDSIQVKLNQWNDFENLRDENQEWVRVIENQLASIDLKPTLSEKKIQFDVLKDLQGEIRAKELEIDNVTEKAQILLRTLPNSNSKHHINELVQKYQQLSHKIKDLTTRWQQYYIVHQEFDRKVSNYSDWLSDLKSKLTYCADSNGNSQKDLEKKLTTIQELILVKEEGSSQLQNIVEGAQNLLANTSTPGHEPINETIARLHEDWSQCTMKMIDLRSSLDDSIHQWSGFLDEIQNIRKSTDSIEMLLNDLSEYQTTMPEKRTQLELIRNIEEKVRVEKIEVDNLRTKTRDMIMKGKDSPPAQQAQEVLTNFDNVFERVKKLLSDREDQYRDHKAYKDAFENLSSYVNRAREKIPMLQPNSLTDKLSVEKSVAPLESLLNKKAQGDLLLEHLQNTSEVVMASTSPNGQNIIRTDIKELKDSFEKLFKEIRQQKEKLEETMIRWRDYKEEHEKLSEWLTQIDILVKNHKLATHPNLQEKQKQVLDMKEIIVKLEKQEDDFNKFNAFAAPLLQSHLESFVTNQLRQLNSRYQVQTNIAKDVMKKIEGNCNQHREFEDFYKRGRHWIDAAKDVIQSCSEGPQTNKEIIKQKLISIQNLIDRREEGQNLVQNIVSTGEKTLKNTKSDGKEIINNQMKEIQSDWERVSKKMSAAKVNLETSLLQWADYSSSYSQLQQWINDREAKLQQATDKKAAKNRKGETGLIERKANLRQTNDIVQDIVSFEPMIQSVTSKASGLQQQSPATEISSKYETLTKQAKELFAKQKDDVEKHQCFLEAGNEFAQWIRNAKEQINKCCEPTGDKEILISKMTQLKTLENDIPNGQEKLQKALEQADIACRNADDREQIEEEVAMLQGEFDNYVDVAKHSKKSLELGIAKWTEFVDKQEEALKWLNDKELLIQSFNKLLTNLEEKRVALENFQQHLQTLFDWQKDLDNLNISAQFLLEICADTRISNAVTQLTTKYNAILSLSKEIMKRLELHYQEHQQHNALYSECEDWLDRIREKVNQYQDVPNKISELQIKVNAVKGIRQSLEQGQNKLRYALELKEKVILSTEASGASKIEEDSANLKQEFEKLLIDTDQTRQKLINRLTLLEDIGKQYKILMDWLSETETQLEGESKIYNELGEKKAALERLRVLQREVQNYAEIHDKIKTKLSDDNNEFATGLQQFEAFQETLSDKIKMLENQVNSHEKYKQSFKESYEWLRLTKNDIEQCSDSHGEREMTLNKLAKIKEIKQSIPEGKILMSNTIELGKKLIPDCDAEGQGLLNDEFVQLESDWQDLDVLSSTISENLEECLTSWNNFANKSNEINAVLAQFQNKLDTYENLSEDVDDVVKVII